MLYEIKHRYSGAVLFSLECGSLKLCVETAISARADLTGANLAQAKLTGADLTGAIYIDGGSDRRSYYFRVLRAASGTLEIRAGCRLWNNFADALAHYDDRYASDGDRAECIARLTLMRDELARRMEQEPPK